MLAAAPLAAFRHPSRAAELTVVPLESPLKPQPPHERRTPARHAVQSSVRATQALLRFPQDSKHCALYVDIKQEVVSALRDLPGTVSDLATPHAG